MVKILASAITAVVLACCVSNAQVNNGYETVRIPTKLNPRCINSNTDEITLSVYRVVVEKAAGFFTDDKQAGIAVVSTLNADGQPAAKTPSVNLLQIADEHKGQVFLPLEYPIASQMPLTQPGNGSKPAMTKNMLLEMYLEKTRDKNKFGTFLTTAGDVLGKVSIPSSPYLTAADTFLKFATESIQNDAKDNGAKLFASVSLQFADRDKDVQACRDAMNAEVGAIAIVAATGSKGPNLLALGNLDKQYCWRYNLGSTAEIEYAKQPSGGCDAVTEADWNEPSNDYVMLFLSADVMLSAQPKIGAHGITNVDVLRLASRHLDDVKNAQALCDSLHASRTLCGVN